MRTIRTANGAWEGRMQAALIVLLAGLLLWLPAQKTLLAAGTTQASEQMRNYLVETGLLPAQDAGAQSAAAQTMEESGFVETAQPGGQTAPASAGTIMRATEDANIRKEPDLQAEILGKASPDALYLVYGSAGDGSWYQIEWQGQTAYIAAEYMAENTQLDSELEESVRQAQENLQGRDAALQNAETPQTVPAAGAQETGFSIPPAGLALAAVLALAAAGAAGYGLARSRGGAGRAAEKAERDMPFRVIDLEQEDLEEDETGDRDI